MSEHCTICRTGDYMICTGCGDHVMPRHPGGQCLECRNEDVLDRLDGTLR